MALALSDRDASPVRRRGDGENEDALGSVMDVAVNLALQDAKLAGGDSIDLTAANLEIGAAERDEHPHPAPLHHLVEITLERLGECRPQRLASLDRFSRRHRSHETRRDGEARCDDETEGGDHPQRQGDFVRSIRQILLRTGRPAARRAFPRGIRKRKPRLELPL